ncbi:hypothetical protein CLOP_g5167 [Closterium sp. NIES-67]|nr:hypothetical protein CLOP_g5167 [Closterium sp. NIES-67]
MLSDSDPAIVMLPDGTIRLFTPPARDAAAEPPSAAYSDSDATDDSRAAGSTVRGLRLSPPPTPPARIRCGDADAADVESAPGAQSESEHTEAHSESALASTSPPTLESPRPSPFLTAADVLREFPRHYLALSSPDPPFSPGVSAIPRPGTTCRFPLGVRWSRAQRTTSFRTRRCAKARKPARRARCCARSRRARRDLIPRLKVATGAAPEAPVVLVTTSHPAGLVLTAPPLHSPVLPTPRAVRVTRSIATVAFRTTSCRNLTR